MTTTTKLSIVQPYAQAQNVQADLLQKTVLMRAQVYVKGEPTGSYLQVVIGPEKQPESNLQHETPSFDDLVASNPKAQAALATMQELVLDMFDKYSKAMDVPADETEDAPQPQAEPETPGN